MGSACECDSPRRRLLLRGVGLGAILLLGACSPSAPPPNPAGAHGPEPPPAIVAVEKPVAGLPLEIRIDAPPVPEEIARPTPAAD